MLLLGSLSPFRAATALAALVAGLSACDSGEPRAPQEPIAVAPAVDGRWSALWGREGEAYRPDGRLPDFSYAGYHRGEDPLPEVPQVADVRDFGAVGDGEADDTGAFLEAIAATADGALFIPAGRYRLSGVLRIRKSNLVLRGAGRDETVLYFTRPLSEILGKGPEGGPSGWSWGGGLVWFEGEMPEEPALARVAEVARRGQTYVVTEDAGAVRPGSWVRLAQYETDGSLSDHIHDGHRFEGRCIIDRPGQQSMDWVVRVERIEGDRVHFDRPLRIDVRPQWGAELLPARPTLREVGVEHLTIEFPTTEYPGHHRGLGFNGIELRWAFDSWVRDVRVVNFDNGIHFRYCRYATGTDLLLEGRGGHYGLSLGGSQDSLMTRFELRNHSQHDLSVANLANGSVFSQGRGPRLNFDHHRGAAYENLFSDLDVGESWRGGGLWWQSDTPSGHYAAARETFWNIRPRIKPSFLPRWPQMNIIGPMKKNRPLRKGVDRLDPWLEPLRRPLPRDLHAAQLARRLARGAGRDPVETPAAGGED